jgi:hypothetical protein
MEKYDYSPLALLKIATQHAYSAENLLHAECLTFAKDTTDPFFPIATLLYSAFSLTLKAYIAHLNKPTKHEKTLTELIDMNTDIFFSAHEKKLIKKLGKQYAFHKGIGYDLFNNRQEQVAFLTEILKLYEQLQEMMPLELRADY